MTQYRIKKTLFPAYDKLGKQRKVLLLTSYLLWFPSLFMVGFYTDGAYWGIAILLLGAISFLFPPEGLAVYANLIFWWIAYRLESGRKEYQAELLSIVMLCVASLSFTLHRVLEDAGGGHEDISAWGYGAIVWGFSLILMAAAALDKRQFRSVFKTLLPYLIVFSIILSVLCGIKYQQWQHATEKERAYYLPTGAAFGVFPPKPVSGLDGKSQQ